MNTWHPGALAPGNSTLLYRRHDGVNFVILFNVQDDIDGKNISDTVSSLLDQVTANFGQVPSRVDYFKSRYRSTPKTKK